MYTYIRFIHLDNCSIYILKKQKKVYSAIIFLNCLLLYIVSSLAVSCLGGTDSSLGNFLCNLFHWNMKFAEDDYLKIHRWVRVCFIKCNSDLLMGGGACLSTHMQLFMFTLKYSSGSLFSFFLYIFSCLFHLLLTIYFYHFYFRSVINSLLTLWKLVRSVDFSQFVVFRQKSFTSCLFNNLVSPSFKLFILYSRTCDWPCKFFSSMPFCFVLYNILCIL